MATFDASPCLNARIDDLDIDYIKSSYLPKIFDADTIAEDTRDIREQLASIHLFDRDNNCLTYAGGSVLGDSVTSEYKINYLRPAIGDTLVARASVLSSGKQQAVCQCQVFCCDDGQEKLAAVAQGTITRVQRTA